MWRKLGEIIGLVTPEGQETWPKTVAGQILLALLFAAGMAALFRIFG